MKPFSQFLMESQRQYAFRVKVAGVELDSEAIERLKQGLGAYDLADMSKPKRLPIAHTDEFHRLGAVERHVFDITTNYPANPPMIAQCIHNSTGIPVGNILVVDPNGNSENTIEFEPGKALLTDTDLPETDKDAQDKVGEKHAMSFLKTLQSTKQEIAGKEKTDGKTTNDLPQNNKSPIKPNTAPRGK